VKGGGFDELLKSRHCERQRSNPPANEGTFGQSVIKAIDLSQDVSGIPFYLVWIASLPLAMTLDVEIGKTAVCDLPSL
jgi:hypothetical protein